VFSLTVLCQDHFLYRYIYAPRFVPQLIVINPCLLSGCERVTQWRGWGAKKLMAGAVVEGELGAGGGAWQRACCGRGGWRLGRRVLAERKEVAVAGGGEEADLCSFVPDHSLVKSQVTPDTDQSILFFL
jgi:hypothetical protein